MWHRRTHATAAWMGGIGISVAVALVVMISWLLAAPAQSQIPVVERPGGLPPMLHVLHRTLNSGADQVIIVDPTTKTMAVYHVADGSGQIELKSVRRITWDLILEEFNGQPPSPKEIRALQP